MVLQILHGRNEVLEELRAVELALHLASLVVCAWVAAQRRQPVRRERQKAFGGHAARHVFDVGIQAAVFVDHQHRRGSCRPSSTATPAGP